MCEVNGAQPDLFVMFNSESWKYDVNQPWAHLITALNPRDLATDSLDDLFIQVGTVRQADKKLEYIRWIEGRGEKKGQMV